MLYKVLRPFNTDREMQIGEEIDVSSWRPHNVEGLVNARYLERVVIVPGPDIAPELEIVPEPESGDSEGPGMADEPKRGRTRKNGL